MKEEIIKMLKNILDKENVEIKLEISGDLSHGDYSTNVALLLAKQLRENPQDIAEEIRERLVGQRLASSFIQKIEAVPPGFINFWVSNQQLTDNLQLITEKREKFGEGTKYKSQKIMVEFADPNPFKEFHIGHLRNITLGESYARLLEAQVAQVWRVNYQGDVGLHVAKAIFGIRKKVESGKVRVDSLEERSIAEKARFLGEAYAAGSKAYEEDESAKKEIQDINKKIYQKDPSIMEIWSKGRKWSLDYFEQIYKRVGTSYKRYYFESEVADPGRQIVVDHVADGVFERHEGAIIFRGEKQGLHTRVFVTKEDYATYEAKDIALAGIKYKDFPYDKSIIITAHEQSPYFQVVLAAMKQVFPDLAGKTIHDSFGFVSLKDVKMSSRLGNIITGEWLLDEAKEKIKDQFKDMDDETAEVVAVGAVKYSMLKYSRESDFAFSFDESISLEGNSGPYLQYTYARTQSVLRKVKSQKLKVKSTTQKLKVDNFQLEELAVLRTLIHFQEVVEDAGEKFAPNLICNYLFELSQKFNLFYQKHSILEGGDRRDFRLALTAAVGQVLKNGLHLLGIKAPEKM